MACRSAARGLLLACIVQMSTATHDTFLHKAMETRSWSELPASGAPSVSDVMSQVSSVNESFNTAMEMISAANSSALSMADQALGLLSTASTALSTGQSIVSASAIVLGEDMAKTLTDAISKANETLTSISGPITQMLDDASEKLNDFVAGLLEQRESVSESFLTSQAKIENLTEAAKAASSLLQQVGISARQVSKKSLLSGECLSKEDTLNYVTHMGLIAGKDAEKLFSVLDGNQDDCLSQSEMRQHVDTSLLARATKSSRVETKNLEQSVAKKSGGSPCDKAMASVGQANASVSAFQAEVIKLNETAVTLVSTAEGTVTSGLGLINSTVKLVTAMAPPTVPSSVISPINAIAEKALSLASQITSQASDAEKQISAKLDTALSPLASLVGLANTLAAATDDACSSSEESE